MILNRAQEENYLQNIFFKMNLLETVAKIFEKKLFQFLFFPKLQDLYNPLQEYDHNLFKKKIS